MKIYTLLSLGDSYTIGEAVPLIKNFPYQTVQLLRHENMPFAAPEIIAKTGWTTDELTEAIGQTAFLPQYDIVTLLIGVNNQYRGRTGENYTKEFEGLLQKAIHFSGGCNNHVIVLSIPDYSVTPFAQSKNIAAIQKEIDEFNSISKTLSDRYGVHYINITESTREAKNNVNLLAEDGLHPSADEYKKWAQQVARKIKSILSEFNG